MYCMVSAEMMKFVSARLEFIGSLFFPKLKAAFRKLYYRSFVVGRSKNGPMLIQSTNNLGAAVKIIVAVVVELLSHGRLFHQPVSWSLLGSSAQSTSHGVNCHCLLQGILLTQGSKPYLLLGRRILYH